MGHSDTKQKTRFEEASDSLRESHDSMSESSFFGPFPANCVVEWAERSESWVIRGNTRSEFSKRNGVVHVDDIYWFLLAMSSQSY